MNGYSEVEPVSFSLSALWIFKSCDFDGKPLNCSFTDLVNYILSGRPSHSRSTYCNVFCNVDYSLTVIVQWFCSNKCRVCKTISMDSQFLSWLIIVCLSLLYFSVPRWLSRHMVCLFPAPPCFSFTRSLHIHRAPHISHLRSTITVCCSWPPSSSTGAPASPHTLASGGASLTAESSRPELGT